VGSEQWAAETGIVVPPTRVFLEKRLQAIENKGRESEIEDKEAAGY
jgi:hypothetical protein